MATITAYLRVSTDKQTMENQRSEIARFASHHGLTVDKWVEEVVSGKVRDSDRKRQFVSGIEGRRSNRETIRRFVVGLRQIRKDSADIFPRWSSETQSGNNPVIYCREVTNRERKRRFVSEKISKWKNKGYRLCADIITNAAQERSMKSCSLPG